MTVTQDRVVVEERPATPIDTSGRAAGAAVDHQTQRAPSRLRSRMTALAFGALGIGVVVGLWAIVAATLAPDLPTPIDGWNALLDLLASPFSAGGPTDQGIALQLGTSLGRVLRGFGWAVVVGVPLGLFIGANRRAWQTANPVVQLLRPVSPLAWFPIGLVVLQDAPGAAVFVIFITALWPIVLNTAAGAASVPADQRNVARVFRFGRVAYVRHVLVPNAMPSIVTGLRVSMGIAWMVIVAVEMLSGGSGIGFFVWDSYNAGNVANVIAAIILIGLVGVVLDMLFMKLGKRYQTEGVTP